MSLPAKPLNGRIFKNDDLRCIGIDPGSSQSGICMINKKTIIHADIIPNHTVFGTIKELSNGGRVNVAIEDITAFNIRVTVQLINTCKFIGELTYRLNTCSFANMDLVYRATVRRWIFNEAPEVCLPRVKKKMESIHAKNIDSGKRGLIRGDGQMREPSFMYVDDRTVVAALKHLYGISTPKPGQRSAYGLKDHSWQALAAASCYQSRSL